MKERMERRKDVEEGYKKQMSIQGGKQANHKKGTKNVAKQASKLASKK